MTLFANSGIAWPKFEQQTQEAGRKSLEAASSLFKVLAAVEGKTNVVSIEELESCSRALDSAANTYALVAEQVSVDSVPTLSPSELELAAIPIHCRHYDEPFNELFLQGSNILIRDLYLELSQRAFRLSAAVRIFNPKNNAVDLAASVFQMMQLWETMAVLARVIATLGRRKPKGRG